ncbi:LacI family DNA-binding transcriptional regulator [Altererythrobacter arenosus]|uniref:LacI family DNA-binding transcriptional regulator n=1 Tax=Altererythrobacter arenosus TaxID=3032592 RepID=A0ABY8FN37_9SPHN|nr:LacI family DNA-binding transcriptional regulator [Altererythrobacter sp. CAU 1644]WFL76192.1 LacI family DNA-binding transcriptional regulator [Altererythrobacter sp. CAU 1644]
MDRPIRKSTAWDVAEKAGVSQSTVSRVFTGSTRISEQTRARVIAAAEALDYLPDKRASRLRSGQTGVIAVVLITRAEDRAQEVNPFTYALLGGVCRAASARGYETLVSFQSSADEFYGRYVEQRDADALIVLGTTQNPAAWEHFRPILQQEDHSICWGLPFDEAHSVRSDNHLGGRLAAEHLWSRGYRNPVFLGPIEGTQRQFSERLDGFCEALKERGGDAHVVGNLGSNDRYGQGREAIERLVSEGREYDSIFAACDFIALGALEALTAKGIAVPGQVGLIGYDGLAATAHANPPLTTIKPDLEEAGRQLVARVLDEETESDTSLAPVELIARASTQRG